MKTPHTISWLEYPEEHNYPSAGSYLLLIYKENTTQSLVKDLQEAPISYFKAKDIFRSSSLSLLGVSNSHVEKDKEKIKSGKPLSPLLLVRDTVNGKVIVADGYHRLCAVYAFNEDSEIPCKIV